MVNLYKRSDTISKVIRDDADIIENPDSRFPEEQELSDFETRETAKRLASQYRNQRRFLNRVLAETYRLNNLGDDLEA